MKYTQVCNFYTLDNSVQGRIEAHTSALMYQIMGMHCHRRVPSSGDICGANHNIEDLLVIFEGGVPVSGVRWTSNARPQSLVRYKYLVHYRLFPIFGSCGLRTMKYSFHRSVDGPLNALRVIE